MVVLTMGVIPRDGREGTGIDLLWFGIFIVLSWSRMAQIHAAGQFNPVRAAGMTNKRDHVDRPAGAADVLPNVRCGPPDLVFSGFGPRCCRGTWLVIGRHERICGKDQSAVCGARVPDERRRQCTAPVAVCRERRDVCLHRAMRWPNAPWARSSAISTTPAFRFTVSPLAPQGTPFQCRVREAIRAIPLAESRTYGEIARRSYRARAVGQPVGANRIALASFLPPRRRQRGALGELMNADGGDPLSIKRWLLRARRLSLRPLREAVRMPSANHVERVDRRICDTSGCGSAPPRVPGGELSARDLVGVGDSARAPQQRRCSRGPRRSSSIGSPISSPAKQVHIGGAPAVGAPPLLSPAHWIAAAARRPHARQRAEKPASAAEISFETAGGALLAAPDIDTMLGLRDRACWRALWRAGCA